jgi:hypothetical protein
MTNRTQYTEDDPRRHTIRLREMLTDVVRHAREDVGKIHEPKAQALFETTAEVCNGLATAYDHYDKQSEPAWQR